MDIAPLSIDTPLLPSICTTPEPFGVRFKLILVSPPVADRVGPLPVAAFVISN
jgi:hypothetical protein